MEQPKQCSVVYHNNTPIAVFDIRTFKNQKEFACFKENCENNLKVFEEKTKEKTHKYENELAKQQEKIDRLEQLVAYLLYERDVDNGKIKAVESEKTLIADILDGGDRQENADFDKILSEVKANVK